MKKVVFIGIRHSGKSSTIQALGKINNKEVINEFWEKEAADIKTILLADQQVVITTCWSAYREEEAFAKTLHNANRIYYFLPIQKEGNNLDVEEIERHINLFPVLLNSTLSD